MHIFFEDKHFGIRKTPTQKIPTHQTPPWKIPTQEIPTQKSPTWNIPTQVFKFFVSFIIVTLIIDIT